MKIFITGANGYLGSHLVKFLSHYYDVYAIVRSSSSLTRLSNIKCNILTADNYNDLSNLFLLYRPETVINTVAIYGRKSEDLITMIDANISYPVNLFEISKKNNVKTFIHTGTSLPENTSQYALTKNTFPRLINNTKLEKIKFIHIALEHFYGEGDDTDKFISYIIAECKKENEIALTEGTQKRDFIYIKDVVNAYYHIIKNLEKIQNNEIIPVGSGYSYPIRDVVKMISKISKSNSKLNFGAISMRENELMNSIADISKLATFGWKPAYSLVNGLKSTILGV